MGERSPLCALALALATASTLPAQQPENVLVVLADDLGVDYVGVYGEGSQPARTPTIDALARRGVLFRNAWAYPSCSPTRAAILTGRHPSRTLVGRWIRHPSNTEPIGTLRPQEWTLPELLDRSGRGYTHACIGKWHLGDATQPLRIPLDPGGFAHFSGFLAGQLPSYYAWPHNRDGVETQNTTYATTQQVDDALAWIGAQRGPWLCYLAFNAPHLPFEAPPAALHSENLAGTTPTNNSRGYYRAMIEAMDREFGRLLTSLGPELDRTWVIFLGDNGSVQNQAVPPFDPARAKGTPYEGGLNVPLILAGPRVHGPGREVQALACAVDVFATALELAGATGVLPTWVDTDGSSLVPYLLDPAQAPLRAFAWSEEFTGALWPAPNTNGHACVRDERFKLIYRVSGTRELFDLQLDPFENTNLLRSPLTPTVQTRYAALLGELGRLRGSRARVQLLDLPRCAGSAGYPVCAAPVPPRFGASFRLELSQAPPLRPALHLLGLSGIRWNGLALPLDLHPLGFGPGCALHLAPDLSLPAATDASGNASSSFPIPNDPTLLEATSFHAWLVDDPAAPGASVGLTISTALAAILGP